MIERALITAAIVVVIIGALGKIGEQANSFFGKVNCAFEGQTECAAKGGEQTDEENENTKSRRNKSNDQRF